MSRIPGRLYAPTVTRKRVLLIDTYATKRDLRSKIGAALSTPAFTRFRKRVDYTEFGGAPLLGIDGEAIICHGRSPAKAIKNAVRVAAEWAKKGLNEHIRAALESEVARGGREGGRE